MSQYAGEFARTHLRRRVRGRSARARAVLALGPLTILAGVVWAFVQPWRLTLLHPAGQGFWWLVIEPPLLVIVGGVLFHALVAQPLVHDLEETEH
jgi:hypothetical protein